MNRIDEYHVLIQELEQNTPDLRQSLSKAKKRRAGKRLILRPLAGVAACFAGFILLVNFCTPVAYACAQVPVLRELAEAVTFSNSLTDAVENEYVQPMDLVQTQAGITATVEYLIADQKQVNVFYRLDSDVYFAMTADPTVENADGTSARCSYGNNSFDEENGALRSITIDFMEEDVPSSLLLKLKVRDQGSSIDAPLENAADYLFEDIYREPEYLAQFDFLLEFDPAFMAPGKIYPVNRTAEVDGQKITITDIEVYPSHLRVNVAEDPENTAHVQHLYFRIEAEPNWQFDPVANGITATGTLDQPLVTSYRADSSYFYEAEHLKLVITGAELLDKSRERVHIALTTGETGPLPQGVVLESAQRQGSGWRLRFRADYRKPNSFHQLFGARFYDAAGREYEINSWSSYFGDADENGESICFIEEFALRDFTEEEVWLSPHYSHVWTAEEEIQIPVS